MKKTLAALCLSLITALPTFAADSPWVGTWKSNIAKSKVTGYTFTYTKMPDGMIRYDDGGPFPRNFRLDGKEYPMAGGRTTAWTATGPNTWDSIARFKGVILFKAHRTLSADGKTYTITTTGTEADGSTSTSKSTYARVTGTSGLEGKWRATKAEGTEDTVIISAKADNILHWESPASKETYEGRLDGSDLPVRGPRTSGEVTIAYRQQSKNSLSYVTKDKGKVVYLGTQTLAADGKSFTDVSWAPGKENEKASILYEKQ